MLAQPTRGPNMLATTAPTLFEGSTATSSACAATADSPVTDAISLQRKTGSGVGTLDSLTAPTIQPVLVHPNVPTLHVTVASTDDRSAYLQVLRGITRLAFRSSSLCSEQGRDEGRRQLLPHPGSGGAISALDDVDHVASVLGGHRCRGAVEHTIDQLHDVLEHVRLVDGPVGSHDVR